MSPERIPLQFGGGLDRESGLLVVEPSSFFDLRNVYLHEGKAIVREGFAAAGSGDFPEVDILLTGHGMRGEKLGIVVGWNNTEHTCYVYRCAPDLSSVELLGEWVNDSVGGWDDAIPRVIMAEVFGRVFLAHDEPLIARRAPTAYYDGVGSGDSLKYLFSSWADGVAGESVGESAESTAAEDRIRFRGVVRHLSYLVGWGFGTAIETRPEFLRISLPDDPTTFDPKHYFIVGDRNDAVIGARPVGGDPGVLKVWKRQESYDMHGYDRRSFQMFLADPSHGIIAGRAFVEVGEGAIVAWAEEGPRLWAGPGPSTSIEIPLGLDEWEPTDLVDEGEEEYAFGVFVPRERVAWFQFNRRVYALTARVPGRWRWSFQELPFDAYGAMVFFEGELAAIAPTGYPAYNPSEAESASFSPNTEPGGTFADVHWRNFNQDGDELVEVWLRPYTGTAAESGDIIEEDGVFRGASDFSEYSVGAGQALAGITLIGQHGAGLFTVTDEGGTLGNVIRWGQSVARSRPVGWVFDAWDGVFDFGEILIRMEVVNVGNDFMGGPAGSFVENMAGNITDANTVQIFRTGGGSNDLYGMQLEPRVDQGSPATGVYTEPTRPFWAWLRMRLTDAGGGNMRWQAKAWLGTLGSEPAGWDLDLNPGSSAAKTNLDGVGFVCDVNGASDNHSLGLAFIAFTTDPAESAAGTVEELQTLEPGEWYLAKTVNVASTFQQETRVTGLTPGTQHDVALRYRRGLLYNPGAEDSDDPTTWPTISQGQFTTTLDPPTISSAVWERTGASAEKVTLTIVPDPDNDDADIRIYRRTSPNGAATLIDTLTAPHADPLEYDDTTISGETLYYYTVTHVDADESPESAQTSIWSGPADIPVLDYKNEFVEGYTLGLDLAAPNDVELHDNYDDAGGVGSFSLRDTETFAAASGEVGAFLLPNVPTEGVSFSAKARVKETAFTTEDFGQFTANIPITVDGSEEE